MATSGTYNFTMTRDDIIGAALRLTGAFGDQDVIPASDITNCAQALNILAKELALNGLPLWCVQDIAVPTVLGQTSYNISTASNTTLPLRILDAYIRDSTGNDTSLLITSRYDYDTLGQKSSQGVPNQLYYDPQLGAGSIIVYNVPADGTRVIHVVIQRQIQDFNLSTDNPDFPQEAFRLLKWCLADEIALEYQAPESVRREINSRAAIYKDKFFDFEQEQASIYFTPSERMRY
jgi:hypothetical protein